MTNEALSERLEQSIEDSLTQLGRGSGITPDARQRMAKMIAHPLVFIVEDEQDAEVSRLQKENERLRQMVAPIRSVVIYGRDAHDGALVGGVSMATWRSLLAELEHTDA